GGRQGRGRSEAAGHRRTRHAFARGRAEPARARLSLGGGERKTGMAHPTGTLPFSRFEWMLAARYMRPRRKRSSGLLISFLSLLGIMIGVAALIVVMAVMNGFREQLI